MTQNVLVIGAIIVLSLLVVVAIIVLTRIGNSATTPVITALVALLATLFTGLLAYVHTLSQKNTPT